ncbi:MAG TPA: SIR2 family protein [Bacillota bacterium]|nr:SIR2 family protein [Bacillota bacterium]
MKKVYLLGSGFSAAAGAPTSIQVLGQIFSQQSADKKLTDLYNWLDTHLFANRPNWLYNTDVEEVLTRLNLFDHYEEQQSLGARTLEANTRLLLQQFVKLLRPENLPVFPAFYDTFARRLNSDDKIITFNYDLILEKSLDGAGLTYDYQLPLQNQDRQTRNDRGKKCIKVAKLHGSINIVFCPENHKLVRLPDDNKVTGLEDASGLGPFIIPPTLFKSYSMPALRQLWYTAFGQLSEAQELVIIGYSLPYADILTAQMLDFAFQKGIIEKVLVVNGPDSDISRLKSVFQTKLENTNLLFTEWIAAAGKDPK